MLAFFPTPYPDETLHSILARYAVYSGLTGYNEVRLDLTGSAIFNSKSELPSRLSELANRIPSDDYTAEKLIYHHTSYSFYAAFKPNIKEDIMEMMLNDGKKDNRNISSILGLHSIKKSNLYHCLKCVEEDKNIYGESYWRRLHQLPGVYICEKHSTPLVYSVTEKFETKSSYINYTVERSLIEKYPVHTKIKQGNVSHLLHYVREARTLLRSETKLKIDNTLTVRYFYALKQKGYVKKNGNIERKKLRKDIATFYGEDVLELLSSPIFIDRKSWPDYVLKGLSTPLKHFLFILFLFGSLKNFNALNPPEVIYKEIIHIKTKNKQFNKGLSNNQRNNMNEKEQNSLPRVKEHRLIDKIDYVVSHWSNYELDRPRRITKYAVQRIIGVSKFKKSILAREYLEVIAESGQDFSLRKLKWAYDKLVASEEQVSRTKLIKLASPNQKYKELLNQFCADYSV
jgi:hypothetical protein